VRVDDLMARGNPSGHNGWGLAFTGLRTKPLSIIGRSIVVEEEEECMTREAYSWRRNDKSRLDSMVFVIANSWCCYDKTVKRGRR